MTRLDYEIELWHKVMTFWDEVGRNSLTILHSQVKLCFHQRCLPKWRLRLFVMLIKIGQHFKARVPTTMELLTYSMELWTRSMTMRFAEPHFFLMFAEFWAWTLSTVNLVTWALGSPIKFICFFWSICSNMQNLGPSLKFSWAWQG